MLSVLALSLQDQIEKYGAYVAVACFVGLALLSILYFAQARELRRLRDWAGRAPERDAELEARVSAQADAARRTTFPAPAPRPATPAATLARETQITSPPPAPAGGNGHAAGDPPTVPMGPRPARAAVAVAAAVAAARSPAARSPAAPAGPEAGTAPAPQETVEADAVSDGAGNGQLPPDESGRAVADVERPVEIARATPRPAPAAPRRPAQAVRSAERSATVPPRRTPPPAAQRRSRPAPAPAPAPARARRNHRGLLVAVVAGLAVIGVAALAITQLGGKSNEPSAPNTTEPQPTASAGATQGVPAGGPAKADTTVVILNGTSTEGLAAKAKDTLQGTGYTTDRMPTSNATNQATARSTVYYAAGRRRQAIDVARALDINAVQASTPDVQSLADNSSDPPVKSDVVVILGADRTP
jgi:hypothetical protein